MRCAVSGDVECMRDGKEFFKGAGAGVLDGGKDDVVVHALGFAARGVKKWEENLRHLLHGFVGE